MPITSQFLTHGWLFPTLMLTALVVGLLMSRRRLGKLPLSPRQRLGLSLSAFCGGMIGSKIPFALADERGPLCSQSWLSDGKTILFGLIGGYVAVEIAKRILNIRQKTGDALVIPIAVAIGIGRWGCFVGGCCYGVETSLPWGVDFGDGIHRHPTQLYEWLFHWSAAIVLWMCERRDLFPRQRLKLYLASYCVFRFATEFLRPEPRLAAQLTGYQWVSLCLLPVIALLWWQDRDAVHDESPATPSGGQA